MYYGDYGNYNSRVSGPNYNLYKPEGTQRMPQEEKGIIFKTANTYSSKFSNINLPKAKTTVELPLTNEAMNIVTKWMSPESAQRVSDNFIGYFE